MNFDMMMIRSIKEQKLNFERNYIFNTKNVIQNILNNNLFENELYWIFI